METDTVKIADLPAKWEREADDMQDRLDSGEISGEVWDGRMEVMRDNALELREALASAADNALVPSSAYRLVDWLAAHGFPNPAPETNDVCDWALAKLQELQNTLELRPAV